MPVLKNPKIVEEEAILGYLKVKSTLVCYIDIAKLIDDYDADVELDPVTLLNLLVYSSEDASKLTCKELFRVVLDEAGESSYDEEQTEFEIVPTWH